MKITLIILIYIVTPVFALASTIYVPDDYAMIQEAIDAATNGDTIIVRPGTYVENIDFIGKTITLISEKGHYETTIEGIKYAPVVRFISGEGPDTILEGFTIKNGYSPDGGGIYCQNASPKLLSCHIINNESDNDGGGICCKKSSALIAYNLISGNKAKSAAGGGIYATSGLILNNIISNNHAGHGGGIYSGSADIRNNLIIENEAVANGGGIYCNNIDSHYTSNTIFSNFASNRGGGIVCGPEGSIKISNSIIWNNYATNGPSIYIYPGGILSATFCDIQGGWPGAGNITANPFFVDITAGDCHIQYNSPCRDAGDNSDPNLTEYDFEGDPRIVYGTTDIGADEFHTRLYYTGNATPGGFVELKFVGEPWSSPVGLWFGLNLLDPPMHSPYGDWYLMYPYSGPIVLGLIPLYGIYVLPGYLPSTTPGPYTLNLQALIGDSLTNLCVINVQ